MIIDNQIIKLISQYKDIGEKIVISYPTAGIMDSARSILVFLNFESVSKEPFPTFGFMKVKEFLDLVSALGGPTLTESTTIELENGMFTVSNGGTHCTYLSTNLELLKNVQPPVQLLEKLNEMTPVFEFELTNANIDKMKKVSALLGLEELEIRNKCITVNSNISKSEFKIDLEGNFVEEPHIVPITATHLKKLPNLDFNVKVLEHETQKGKYLTWLTIKGDESNMVNIILAMNHRTQEV